MSEHTPAPTPDRATYGLALYLLFSTLFTIYVLWAFIPSSILVGKLGLTYLPDQYFALYLPIFALCATTIFAFFIYPGLNTALTPNVDDRRCIRDTNSIVRCGFSFEDGRACNNQANQNTCWQSKRLCEAHEKFSEKQTSFEQREKINWCDCPLDSDCLLHKDPDYVQYLRLKPEIPAICDVDPSDVCKGIFGN